jgi:hypothetical protein
MHNAMRFVVTGLKNANFALIADPDCVVSVFGDLRLRKKLKPADLLRGLLHEHSRTGAGMEAKTRRVAVSCCSQTHPYPTCGKRGRRKDVLRRDVRSIAFHEVVILEITYGEHRATCDCCKTFRSSPPRHRPLPSAGLRSLAKDPNPHHRLPTKPLIHQHAPFATQPPSRWRLPITVGLGEKCLFSFAIGRKVHSKAKAVLTLAV